MKKIYLIYKNLLYFTNCFYFISKNAIKYFSVIKTIKILSKYSKYYFLSLFVLSKKYKKNREDFISLTKELKFSNDWFSNNIPNWLFFFNKEKKIKIKKVLEIGSYEGMSSLFLLMQFNDATIDCVETFLGSDEHKKIDFSIIEKNFKFNLKNYFERYKLFKMTSKNFFFEKNYERNFYDLIYIDGSHFKDDVYFDAIQSFDRLNINGLIIFDDFLRNYYHKEDENVIGAVFEFLKKFESKIEIIFVGYQICIKKISI